MKVLVTGAAGQLGADLCAALAAAGHQAVGLTRREMDLADPAAIRQCIGGESADWVVNCGAYTQVDKAESECELAYAVNGTAAGVIAECAAGAGARLLQVSTDFVFDGARSSPYSETDEASPLGVYGASKYAGEQAVLERLPGALIVRTAWVHGAQGHNFVKTMLRLAAERDALTVVDDQIGSPSWTGDIAAAMLALMEQDAEGVFHYTNEGVASWYDFAQAILEEARQLGRPVKAQRVVPIATEQYPTPARRPPYSVLSKQKIRGVLAAPIPHWRDGLRAMLQELT